MGHDDVGIRLVVAKQYVVARRQPLDQIVFEQQRLGLGTRCARFDTGDLRHHQGDARTGLVLAKVRRDPLF